jgi:hypothetical protein
LRLSAWLTRKHFRTLYGARGSVIEFSDSFMASQRHAPHSCENRFWKSAYAWNSFQHVRDICDNILSQQIQPEDTIYYPLVTAICVLYARPFKRSRGIESLSMQFVPRKFHRLHVLLITLRDQTIAHVDARSFPFKGLPANNVRLIVQDRQVRLEPNEVKFKLETVSEIRALAGALINRMQEYTSKLVGQYPSDVPDGEYLIDLTTETFRRL